MSRRLAELMIQKRWWLLVIASILFILGWYPSQNLQMDRRIEQMFPVGDPSVESFQLLRERFGGNAVAMLVYRDESLLTIAGLQRVQLIADQASEIPGVLGVLSLSHVNEALASTSPPPLFGPVGPPPILQNDVLARGFRQLFQGYTHDKEGVYAAVVVMLDPSKPAVHDDSIRLLRELGDSLVDSSDTEQESVALVGEPVLVAEGFALVEKDGDRLSTVTIILLGLTTLVMFRSPRWVIAELVVIFWAVTTTRAAATLLGLKLSMVSSMLTAIVTVIAVASVIHVAVAFGVRRRRGDSPLMATRRTLIRIMPPIIWACLTDAAGFAALSISKVGPVRDFGLMMTLGTGMVLIGVILILPAIMLMPPRRFVSFAIPADRWIRRMMVRSILAIYQYRIAMYAVSFIILSGTLLGLTRLDVETNFIKNFRSGSELARGYAMVETEFGGAGVWDIILPMPSNLSSSYLTSVRELEQKLRSIQVGTRESQERYQAKLTKVLSMADADAVAGSQGFLRLAPPTLRIAGMRNAMPAFVDALLTNSGNEVPEYLRIMLRSPERLPSETKIALIDEVARTVDQHTSTSEWNDFFADEEALHPAGQRNGQVTGYYVLLARLIESLLSDQWLCLALASAVIFVVIWIAFRSLVLAIVCMVPNILPVLFVLGATGLFGVRVNMGAAMIAAVSIGLTIDGSIHFLTGYQASRRRGDSRMRAVLHAQRNVGLPVLLATIALALGFSVLITSSFIPTVTFGFLVSAALIAGTVANLTLLPLLLMGNTTLALQRLPVARKT